MLPFIILGFLGLSYCRLAGFTRTQASMERGFPRWRCGLVERFQTEPIAAAACWPMGDPVGSARRRVRVCEFCGPGRPARCRELPRRPSGCGTCGRAPLGCRPLPVVRVLATRRGCVALGSPVLGLAAPSPLPPSPTSNAPGPSIERSTWDSAAKLTTAAGWCSLSS